jgi:hypothetical protein
MEGERIASPCTQNCCLDESNICLGCGRSLEEIIRWSTAAADEQRQILANCRRRSDERLTKQGLRG